MRVSSSRTYFKAGERIRQEEGSFDVTIRAEAMQAEGLTDDGEAFAAFEAQAEKYAGSVKLERS